jgi:hypothetical protein
MTVAEPLAVVEDVLFTLETTLDILTSRFLGAGRRCADLSLGHQGLPRLFARLSTTTLAGASASQSSA